MNSPFWNDPSPPPSPTHPPINLKCGGRCRQAQSFKAWAERKHWFEFSFRGTQQFIPVDIYLFLRQLINTEIRI